MSYRLAPTTTPDTKFFWDALKEGKLLIQRCAGCATLRHPPRPMCPRCNSLTWDTVESSGRRPLYSFVLPRHPQWPWFDGTYIVALVELEEGTRIVSNLCDVDPADVTIGMPVQAFIEHFDNGVSLPQFRPRENGRPDDEDAPSTGMRSGSETPVTPMTHRRHRHGGGRRRDRVARLHAGAPRSRLRQLAGLAQHLHEHHGRQRFTAAAS